MRFDVLTLFPEIFDGYLGESLVKLAQDRGLVEVHRWNIRDWSPDPKHHKVDDRPFGGGPGMVMMPEPVFAAVEAVQAKAEPGLLVMLTPAGERLTQRVVEELAKQPRMAGFHCRRSSVSVRAARRRCFRLTLIITRI